MTLPNRLFAPGPLRKILIGLGIGFLFYTIAGFFVLPPILRSAAVKKLSAALNRPVSIRQVRINPYAISLTVNGFRFPDREGQPLLEFESLYVNLQASSLFRLAPVVKEVRLVAPEARIVRLDGKTFNFSDLLGPENRPAPEPESDSPMPRFAVRRISVSGGQVRFVDREKKTDHSLDRVSVSVGNLSNLSGDREAGSTVSAIARLDGADIEIGGTAHPFSDSLETELNLVVKNLSLPRYAAYVPPIRGKLRSGFLDLNLAIGFSRKGETASSLTAAGPVVLRQFEAVDPRGERMVAFSELRVESIPANLLTPEIHLSRIVLDSPDIAMERAASGRLSLLDLVPEVGAPKPAAGNDRPGALSVRIDEVTIRSGRAAFVDWALKDKSRIGVAPIDLTVSGFFLDAAGKKVRIGTVAARQGIVSCRRDRRKMVSLPAQTAEKPAGDFPEADPAATWQVTVGDLAIGDYRIDLEDRVPIEPVISRLSRVEIQGQNLSTGEGEKGTIVLSFLGGHGGQIAVKGDLQLNPMSTDLEISVQNGDIRAFQPYFTDRVKIIVTSGRVSGSGRFTLQAAPKTGLTVRFKGEGGVSGFASVDKKDAQDFLKWKSLYVSGVDLAVLPLTLRVSAVALTDFYSRLIIGEDGTINVRGVFKSDEDKPAAQHQKRGDSTPKNKNPGSEGAIFIDTVTLENGRINFTDQLNKLNFNADLMNIGGRVSGVSSTAGETADVLLKGSWEGHAPLEIRGKVNPLAEERFVDLVMTISDIDLSPFSPYTGKFLGYKLDKGKLTLELGYKLEGNRIRGDNRARFRELTLGDKVDSPDATSLPVSLAISLLRDPNDEINLDIPIQGDLNDPDFSLTRTVLAVIGNTLVKIISSPFAWLGKLAGGAELSFVPFDVGSDTIGTEQKKTLDDLAAALKERPKLNLEIQGDVDTTGDRTALRQKRLQNLLKSEKLKDMVSREQIPIPLEKIRINADERDRFLRLAYGAADFPKPREPDGRIKKLPAPEMEKLLLTHIALSDQDLRQLAVERAEMVQTYLLATGQIGPDRLFIIEPRLGGGKTEDEEGKSQVKFTLK